jgi:hypothetical protein
MGELLGQDLCRKAKKCTLLDESEVWDWMAVVTVAWGEGEVGLCSGLQPRPHP